MRKVESKPSKVFISHAANDEPIIDKFVDLLQTGLNLQHDDIFCTSVTGLGVKGGANFVDYIKAKIDSSTLVIAYLSKSYFESQFCLSELGATWITAKEFLPLLDTSLEYSDAKGVLIGAHIYKITDVDDMNEFCEEALNILGVDAKTSRLVRKTIDFISEYPSLQAKVKQPFRVSEKKYNTIVNQLESARKEIKQFELDIVKKEKLIEDLKKCKEKDDVKKVMKLAAETNENDEFEELKQQLSRKDIFPSEIARYIAWDHFGLASKPDFHYYQDEYDAAIASRYFHYDDGVLTVNTSNKKVAAFLTAIDEIGSFLETASSDFINELGEKHDVDVEINNAEFLKDVLDIG